MGVLRSSIPTTTTVASSLSYFCLASFLPLVANLCRVGCLVGFFYVLLYSVAASLAQVFVSVLPLAFFFLSIDESKLVFDEYVFFSSLLLTSNKQML